MCRLKCIILTSEVVIHPGVERAVKGGLHFCSVHIVEILTCDVHETRFSTVSMGSIDLISKQN